MTLIVYGLNHTTADVEQRERVALSEQGLDALLADSVAQMGVQQLALLSTCNRTEVYTCSEAPQKAVAGIQDWFARRLGHAESFQALPCYAYSGDEGLAHLMRVGAGLDSLVLGEPQIFGQLKAAHAQASEHGVLSKDLARIFEYVFATVKNVRSQTAIGENPVSLASAAVHLSRRVYGELDDCTALLIGAGETISLAAQHLHGGGIARMIVANRSRTNALALATEFGGEAVQLSALAEQLERADIVISATSSQTPVISRPLVEQALARRRNRPIFMVDIAVPRDIEPEISELDNVYLYSIDELGTVVDENRRERQAAAVEAQSLIATAVRNFELKTAQLGVVDDVKAFRSNSETIRDAELERALAQLRNGADAEHVLRSFSVSLTNKIIHTPSIEIKRAGEAQQKDKLNWARELLGINGKPD